MHNRPRTIIRHAVAASAAVMLGGAALSAQALEVTGSFTGWWGQPEQQNHGLIVSVSRLPDGEKTGVLYWAHFDSMGNPSWLFAQGDIEDEMIDARVFAFDGITFMQAEDPDANFGEQIGTMQVEFSDCLTGQVTFETSDPEIGSGEFPIERLTNQPGTVCSGGIGDDNGPGDLPQRFDIDLAPTGVIPDASGSAKFKLTPGEGEFEVEIENVPAGDYELQVGGETQGMITVVDTGTGSGEIEFRSPQVPGTELLDFDPRDQIIDVLSGSEVILTALAPESGDFVGNGPPPFDTPATGRLELELELTNLGVFPEGSAEAEFEMNGNRVEFEVEVDDVPVGTYVLFVGGVKRGDIEVFETDDGGTAGEIEFRFPPTGGAPFFDFDPRGQTIEILEGATVLFSGEFPDESAGDGPGGDDGEGPPDGAGPPGDDDDEGPPDGAGPPGDDDDEGPPDGAGPPGDDDDEGPRTEISVPLENTGVFPEAEAEAEFEQRGERTEFKVEIEDVPVGMYPLVVGGVERGLIDVTGTDDGTEGEIRFQDPASDADDLPLDFDPRGETVEILDGAGSVIFTVEFPG